LSANGRGDGTWIDYLRDPLKGRLPLVVRLPVLTFLISVSVHDARFEARCTLTISVVPSTILVAVLGERSCQRCSTSNRSVYVGCGGMTTVVRGVVERMDLTIRIFVTLVLCLVSETKGKTLRHRSSVELTMGICWLPYMVKTVLGPIELGGDCGASK